MTLIWRMAVIVTCTWAGYSFAADVRGRVNGVNRYANSPFPLNGESVTLFQQGSGEWRSINRTYTDSAGVYWFKAVAPGQYFIQVSGKNYAIQIGSGSFQDLPTILVR